MVESNLSNLKISEPFKYAFFREDKEKVTGYSPELICMKNKDHPD